MNYKQNIAALATAFALGGCATVQGVLGLERKVAPAPVEASTNYCSNSQYQGLKKKFDKSEEKVSPFEKLMLLAEESGGKMSGAYPGEKKATYSVEVGKIERECRRANNWGIACSPRGPEKYQVSVKVKGQIGDNLGGIVLQYSLSDKIDEGDENEKRERSDKSSRKDQDRLDIDSFTIRNREGKRILELNDATEDDAEVHGMYVRRVVDQVLASAVGSVSTKYQDCVSARDAHKSMIGRDLGLANQSKAAESLAKKR